MKSPASTPLDGLFDLACRDGVDIRSTLLRVTTDLYVQKPAHTREEETQYVELALGLIAAADAPTRAAVAASLSNYPHAPAAVLAKLTEDATPQPAKARSEPLAETLANLLADAEPDMPAPAMPPVRAPQPPAALSDNRVEMFFAADADERRLILTTLDLLGGPPAERPAPVSGDVMSRLEATALQHNVGEFVRTLAGALGIGTTLAERIATDSLGEPIVVAAKAIGMNAAVLQRILLFVNPAIGQSVDRIFDLARLFDDIQTEAAARMLAIWRAESRPAKPRHQPVYYDDERRAARAQPGASRQRAGRSGIEQPLRGTGSGR